MRGPRRNSLPLHSRCTASPVVIFCVMMAGSNMWFAGNMRVQLSETDITEFLSSAAFPKNTSTTKSAAASPFSAVTNLEQETKSHLEESKMGKMVEQETPNGSIPERKREMALGVLYPPGILGGYCNQVIRFISMVEYAQQNEIPYLFLPSLWWNTKVSTPVMSNMQVKSNDDEAIHTATPVPAYEMLMEYPIPMDLVFDVELWNKLASQPDSLLPLLVNDLPANPIPIQCWQTLSRKGNDDILKRKATEKYSQVTGTFLSPSNSETQVRDMVRELTNKTYQAAASASVWPVETILERYGYIPAILNETVQMMTNSLIKFRRRDLLPRVVDGVDDSSSNINSTMTTSFCNSNTSSLTFYGGGYAAGRLWHQGLQRDSRIEQLLEQFNQNNDTEDPKIDITKQPEFLLESQVILALRPAPKWRQISERCVQSRSAYLRPPIQAANEYNNEMNEKDKQQYHASANMAAATNQNYLALHARIELDMMDHACGKNMEHSLERILDQVRNFLASSWMNQTMSHHPPTGILLAVSREGIIGTGFPENKVKKHALKAQENAATLAKYVDDSGHPTAQHLRFTNTFGTTTSDRNLNHTFSSVEVPIFECGSLALDEYYYQYHTATKEKENDNFISHYGTILDSLVDFEACVNARIFIGVKGSSFSTYVWKTRYLQGKGSYNYYYSKGSQTILPVENGGLPYPHKNNCKK